MERLREMADESVHCVVTSPPYWGLRDYGTAPQIWGGRSDCEHQWNNERYYTEQTAAKCSSDAFSEPGEANAARLKEGRWRDNCWCNECHAWRGQLGLEPTPELYVQHVVDGFREVRRVLRSDGTLWLNMGDSYVANRGNSLEKPGYDNKAAQGHAGLAIRQHQIGGNGLKEKDLCGIPWMVAFALRADGWWLRQDIIWSKPNPMPESVTDRCTKSHEYLFLLTKSERYFYDAEAIKEASVTGDERRPYTSEGAWQLDGRPIEQRHGGKPRNGANSLRGQGAERSSITGPANRDGRDMTTLGVGAFRNRRSVWEIATAPFPEAHFATFPPKVVEPCILAGTSEKGCCPECGAPWERITETKPMVIDRSSRTHDLGRTRSSGTMVEPPETRTLGWQPVCRCTRPQAFTHADLLPCTVLDPFSGAGTTGLVATRFHRNFIGIELSPDYCEMARRRITQDAPLFNTVGVIP